MNIFAISTKQLDNTLLTRRFWSDVYSQESFRAFLNVAFIMSDGAAAYELPTNCKYKSHVGQQVSRSAGQQVSRSAGQQVSWSVGCVA